MTVIIAHLPHHNATIVVATIQFYSVHALVMNKKKILTVKITKNISFPEARKIVNDRTPKPGISYSSALNSVVAPSCSQNMQPAPSIINTPRAPTIVTPPSDIDVITIKKSD
ncbi:hypothetical protein AVEN_78200-1 [Araneus ventricosus]|uniref:Uncharacterized protein n=1 Tax=Araneus ventricosus TaxID=182803 RepID=A0A4Y2R671_ARAVE|nr:hypothetical protein AVEN_78200-1 [Araneus ventricosus]